MTQRDLLRDYCTADNSASQFSAAPVSDVSRGSKSIVRALGLFDESGDDRLSCFVDGAFLPLPRDCGSRGIARTRDYRKNHPFSQSVPKPLIKKRDIWIHPRMWFSSTPMGDDSLESAKICQVIQSTFFSRAKRPRMSFSSSTGPQCDQSGLLG